MADHKRKRGEDEDDDKNPREGKRVRTVEVEEVVLTQMISNKMASKLIKHFNHLWERESMHDEPHCLVKIRLPFTPTIYFSWQNTGDSWRVLVTNDRLQDFFDHHYDSIEKLAEIFQDMPDALIEIEDWLEDDIKGGKIGYATNGLWIEDVEGNHCSHLKHGTNPMWKNSYMCSMCGLQQCTNCPNPLGCNVCHQAKVPHPCNKCIEEEGIEMQTCQYCKRAICPRHVIHVKEFKATFCSWNCEEDNTGCLMSFLQEIHSSYKPLMTNHSL